MGVIQLEITEQQIIEWVKQLSPSAKRAVLQSLIPDLDRFEAIVDYGIQQARKVAAREGIDWDRLSEEERETLIDQWLHEPLPNG